MVIFQSYFDILNRGDIPYISHKITIKSHYLNHYKIPLSHYNIPLNQWGCNQQLPGSNFEAGEAAERSGAPNDVQGKVEVETQETWPSYQPENIGKP